ncbi:hypothetical protein [Bacillus mycoides]|uniref:hypothetical protein n=1 Tax=Bacillus mycoides TaxID=1405 RepID=UPI003D654AB8
MDDEENLKLVFVFSTSTKGISIDFFRLEGVAKLINIQKQLHKEISILERMIVTQSISKRTDLQDRCKIEQPF